MFGSKIDNLLTVKEKGFNVSKFNIIKFEDAFENKVDLMELINSNKELSSKELSQLLKKQIDENIKQNFKLELDCEKYAVRSSSNIEDGKEDSFAGQFDTYLNVTKDELNFRIINCFKSLCNENVLEYLLQKSIKPDEFKMNVIVQEMVQSELSGVIFTANPQGILNESVIVVGKGLGENVVLDKIQTTSYYYNLTDKVYYFEGTQDYLEREKIENLISISQEVTKVLGKYLDIEFGIIDEKIYLLQARNVTTINDNNPLILDNSNIVESYPGVSLPLTISFVKLVYGEIFKSVSSRILKNDTELNKHLEVFNNMVGSANGRIYYKISNWYTLIKFLPFNKKIIPIWQEMLGVKNKSYDNEKVKLSIYTRIRTYINSFYELYRTPKNMNKVNQKFIDINKEFYQKFSEKLDEKKIIQLYKELEQELSTCWDVTLLNDTYTFIYTGILKNRLKKKYENFEEMANKYISGISNIESMKPIKEIIKLAYLKESLSNEKYEICFKKYIENYGDRNLEELKLESLTFRTTPELLEERINEYRSDMLKLKENYANMNNVSKIDFNKEDAKTKKYIKKCMLGIKNREISRLNRSRIFGMFRTMFLQLGKIYYEQGIIEDTKDIFYLNLEEIEKLVYEKNDMKNVVLERKEDYKLYKLLPAYTRLIFMEKEFDKHHTSVNTNKFYTNDLELRGIPCSNGIVRGNALIINNVNEAKNVKDKILITKMTDPGWIFLLATAKGVVSEKGSLLSHTAIISRELKIPSIVGVNNLLDTIRNDDEIEINGTTGMIKIIKRAENEMCKI